MKITDNETEWAKIGKIPTTFNFVGKETIIFGTSCHLIFINLSSGEELVYTANTQKSGDGIKCFTSHRSHNVFAFAENRTKPNIFVKTYPNFEEIAICKEGVTRGYIALAFTHTDYLVSLGDLPDFILTVWNWRSGEKMASKYSNIWTQNQILRCNFGNSGAYLAQLGVGTTQIHVWSFFICGKKSFLTQNIIQVPEKCNPISSCIWTTEDALFVLDTAGCVYTVFPDHNQMEKIIQFSEPGDIPTALTWYKSGIALLGPTNEIRHYKKSGSWSVDWTFKLLEPMTRILARLDNLIGLTEKFDLVQILESQNEFQYIKRNHSNFNDFCLIYPTGQYLMALCHCNINDSMINLYEVSTGDLISSLQIDGQALMVKENPKFPYAAVGLERGTVKLVSAYKPEKLVRLTQFYLTKNPINSIYFNECGTVFVAANVTIGQFFIIEGLPGSQMQIKATLYTSHQIADYVMIVSEKCYRIFSIPVTSDKYIAGNQVVRYCIVKDKCIDIKKYLFEENGVLYSKIYATCGMNRDKVFYVIPREGKTINEIKIKRGDDVVQLTQKIVTGHQMLEIEMRRNQKNVLTWAFDGFVILRGSDFTRNGGICLPHHRMEGGVKKAYVDSYEKYIISLGRDNVLVCTNLVKREIDSELKDESERLLNSTNYKLLFTKCTIGFMPKGAYEGKCYLEVEEIMKVEKERVENLAERTDILKEFKSIQEELQELLSENLRNPDNEKLDMKEFNLDTKLYENKARRHKVLCTATERYLKNLIEAHDRISEYMLDNFWGAMQIPETAIRAIFANFEVTNYPLHPPNLALQEVFKWIRHQRRTERYLNDMNSFHPWVPIAEGELIQLMSLRPRLPATEEEIAVLTEQDVHRPRTEERAEEDLESKIAFSGSDTARFIQENENQYRQNEVHSYLQTEISGWLCKSNSYNLKREFNQIFDRVMRMKIKEMEHVKAKNKYLRHIVTEINYLSEKQIHLKIEDPEWVQKETPELVTQVKDEEVPITPYISPSQQALIDAREAEAERLRLLLLADDFRERALMAMMNGVLKVRWEDELKKDVPLPKCMIEKKVENFNEDDLKAVRDYEEKVKVLKGEREIYKKTLRVQYEKAKVSVRKHIKRFNSRLSNLYKLRLKIDSAVSQETLKIVRLKQYSQNRRLAIHRTRERILRGIESNNHIIDNWRKSIISLNESLTECRSYVKSYQNKHKSLEKAFKKNIQHMPPLVQEQAWKIYRKRPRVELRSINSAIILNELAKFIIDPNTKPLATLNQDCLVFLKSLDNLDLHLGVAKVVNEPTYALICKHRRSKIEFEVKLKAAQCEVAEGEATLVEFHRRLTVREEEGVKLNEEMFQARAYFKRRGLNRENQIVLQRGIVEIPLTGSANDFQDAVLVCRKEVEDINKIISKFGERKIKAVQQSLLFQRKILATEWEHERLKMFIQDLKEKLFDMNDFRMTKEVQSIVKNKKKIIPFETEVEMIRASYENTIQERKDKISKIHKRINAIKAHDRLTEQKIHEMNVAICEYNLVKDQQPIDEKEKAIVDSRMKMLMKRSNLVRQIQDNHHEILALQTELELLRLKTYPTLKYTTRS